VSADDEEIGPHLLHGAGNYLEGITFLNPQRHVRATKLVRCDEWDEFIDGPPAFAGDVLVDGSSIDPRKGHLAFPKREERVEKRDAFVADHPGRLGGPDRVGRWL
jgi:hypothetical protein